MAFRTVDAERMLGGRACRESGYEPVMIVRSMCTSFRTKVALRLGIRIARLRTIDTSMKRTGSIKDPAVTVAHQAIRDDSRGDDGSLVEGIGLEDAITRLPQNTRVAAWRHDFRGEDQLHVDTCFRRETLSRSSGFRRAECAVPVAIPISFTSEMSPSFATAGIRLWRRGDPAAALPAASSLELPSASVVINVPRRNFALT